ncbi:ribosomal protein S6 kinase delta-1-like [Diadema antillarum]|uniref:ribosomal protein S6 kinase delta-1-like n=1 Tax=Diadema antillarum TaxID=105358 RepID=UPI003A866403
MASSKDTWIRSFNVSEPTKHEKGFTVYKVTYRAFRLDKPEEVIEVTVWKRYNDFKKLYQALSLIHYHLRRPEKFPDFAKARFFGRFEESVIEERRQSALRLLEFTVKVPPLAKANQFVEFFKGGESVTRRKVSETDAILQPQVIHARVQDTSSVAQGASKTATPSVVVASIPRTGGEGQENQTEVPPAPSQSQGQSQGDELGGVWLHRQMEDDLGMEGKEEQKEGADTYDDSEDDSRTTFSEDSMPSTPLPQLEDLTLFDPLSSDAPASVESNTLPHSNSWLFQAMDICAEINGDSPDLESTPGSSTPSESIVNGSTDSGITVSVTPSLPSSESYSTFSSASSVPASRSSHSSLARAYLNSLRAQQAADEDARVLDAGSIVSGSGKSGRSRHVSSDSITKWDMSGQDDYLYQAAEKISLALDNQSIGNYQASFDAYKAGVAVLLKGVVDDKSKTRREAVRKKTAQYLMKAEDIYNKYLSVEASNARRWESEKVMMEVDPSSAHLRGSTDELKNFKVLGCINSVLLVLDMTTYQSFIIKSLSKCSIPNEKVTTRVPAFCPYMVRLYRYIETESTIFLLLEHATGGRLWDYASPYLQQAKDSKLRQGVGESLKSSSTSRQTQRSRSSSCISRKGGGAGILAAGDEGTSSDPRSVISGGTELGELTQSAQEHEVNDDAAFVGSLDEKLTTPSDIASSYVNLLDACGEKVDSGSAFVDENVNPKRLSDANLNDLVNESSNYDSFNVSLSVSHSENVPNDDSVFMSDTQVEEDEFNVHRAGWSTPNKTEFPCISEITSNSQPPSMALFSIDSIESPNDFNVSEMGDSSVFGFDSNSQSEPKLEKGHNVTPEDISQDSADKQCSRGTADLDPSKVVFEGLAVVQEVEHMREQDAEIGASGLLTGMQEDSLSNLIGEINASAEAKTFRGKGALLDTRGFGVFKEEETAPGVDLAEFFESEAGASKSRTHSCPPEPGIVSGKPSFTGGVHRRHLEHSASMFEILPSGSREQQQLSPGRSQSVTQEPHEKNDWSSFFKSDLPETKGFGFQSEEKEDSAPRLTASEICDDVLAAHDGEEFQVNGVDLLKLPDVPSRVAPNVSDEPERTSDSPSEEDQVYGLSRQNPDGAPSEELDLERKANKSSKDTKPPCSTPKEDVHLHVNPFDSESQLVLTENKGLECPTTYVSVNPKDANLPSTVVLRDQSSSPGGSAQSTPKHTFKAIDTSPQNSAAVHSSKFTSGLETDANASGTMAHTRSLENSVKGRADSDNRASGGTHSNPQSDIDMDKTPTHSRTSTLGAEGAGKQETGLPSLSRLFSYLDDVQRARSESGATTLPESCIRIWASEILVALRTLHAAGIVCRDLNPSNILLTEGGHIRLTYFCQWKWVSRESNQDAAKRLYVAPEARGIFQPGPACDWWSYGAILFELLTGQSLFSCHPSGINSHTQLHIPGDHISPEAKALLTQLLQVNPFERLGGSHSGAEDVKSHPFFKGVNWSNLLG